MYPVPKGKFVAHPTMVAFGVGKRECLGKSLAKQETFLFPSCLLHQFAFDPSSAGPPDLMQLWLELQEFPTRSR
jgi:cytochrome P450